MPPMSIRRMSAIKLALGAGLMGLSASAAEAQAARAARAAPGFDGRWSVEVITEKGDCDRAYRYPVVIEKGQARYGGREDFNVSGSVAKNGAVNATISRGQDAAKVMGRLSGGSGTGTWTASGSLASCSGRWNAERQG